MVLTSKSTKQVVLLARCEPVEVGCQGFAGHSLQGTLKLIVVKGLQCTGVTKNIAEASEGALQWLRIWRGVVCGAVHHLDTSRGRDQPWLGRQSDFSFINYHGFPKHLGSAPKILYYIDQLLF